MKLRRGQAVGESPVREAVVRYVASGLAAVVLISVLGVWLAARGRSGPQWDMGPTTRAARE